MTIIRIGLDTSKHVFQVHGVDENEQPVLRRRLGRSEVAKFFAKLAPSRIGLEACGASHYWARVLRGALKAELGDGLAVMRSIKAALDPHDIFNPGKIIPA